MTLHLLDIFLETKAAREPAGMLEYFTFPREIDRHAFLQSAR